MKPNQVTNEHAAPTSKQIKFAESLARQAGYRYLTEAYKAWAGKNKVGGFNRTETSQLIDWLQS